MRFDVAVIGGGLGGCAAALAALRNGMRVVMTEETDWIGGQATSQAVPFDEHPWIEMFGCTRSYRTLRNGIRGFYLRNYPLTEEARAEQYFNPGDGWVSRFTFEPKAALATLESMLAPWIAGGQLVVLLHHHPAAADVEGDRVRAVTARSAGGIERTIEAAYFLDATEQGDLLPLSKTEFVTGSEARTETGEPRASPIARPGNIQAVTVCFAIDYRPGEDHTIDKPSGYDFWRDYVPKTAPPWPGRLFAWETPPRNTGTRSAPLYFDPSLELPRPAGALNLFTYRRIASKHKFRPGAFASDVSLVNWPQNDYMAGNLHGGTGQDAARHLEAARQLSLSLLYWIQIEAPRPGGKQGWPGVRLRPDVTGTEDGLALRPYIRESRRIKAEFTVAEQHVLVDLRAKATGKPPSEVTAEPFPDTVGIGSYRLDLHPTTGGDNYIGFPTLPFQIPLGALIPQRVENLLAACKNLGVTHLTNGCYRLHPVEWNIGEAAGAVAARAIQIKTPPRGIRSNSRRLKDFQDLLRDQGVELAWPRATAR